MFDLESAALAQISLHFDLFVIEAVADTLLALCSFLLGVGLLYLLPRHVEQPFWPLVRMFIAVLLTYSALYVVALLTLWYPLDWLEVGCKAAMACLMVATALVIVRSLPAMAALGSRTKLAGVNAQLEVLNAELSAAVASAEDARKELAVAADKLHMQSVTDELTGVGNRRGLDGRLAEALGDARRSSGTVSLLMLDIDNFKQYNDTFGHAKGDECLRVMAQAIRGSLRRPRDFVARFGGEEFVVIMEGTDAVGASFLAERARAAVAALDLPQGKGARLPFVTVSVGVATAKTIDELVPELLLARADEAMYAVKAAGGNGVIVAQETVPLH